MGSESFSWIIEGVLGGMARPGMIMDLADDLAHLRDSCNVGCVISLTERPLDAAVLEQVNILSYHFPVADFTPPTQETIESVAQIVDTARKGDVAVAIHCTAGLGRTGTMLACMLVREGMQPDQAIQRVRLLRPGSIETPEQEQAVHDYAEYLNQRES